MWWRNKPEHEEKGPWCMGIAGLCSSVGSVEEDHVEVGGKLRPRDIS